MPADGRAALDMHEVSEDDERRPHYQRNDYLGWIAGEARQQRIGQMIAEFKQRGVYMGVKHTPSEKR
jgi:hypothetical protein